MTVNRLAIPEPQERSSRSVAEWVWPLVPIGLSMFVLSALLYYHLRHDVVVVSSPLQSLIAGIYAWLGFAPAFLLFLLVLTWSSIWFVSGRLDRPLARVLRLLAMTVMLGVFMNLGDGGVAPAFHKGELGAWLATQLWSAFGYYPTLVLVWVVTFGSLLLATDFFFSENFERLRQRPAADAGVEASVTEHLKGLAAATGSPLDALEPLPAEAFPPAVARGGLRSDARSGAADADDGEVEVEPAVDLLSEPGAGSSRRESYFERRYGETRRPAGADEAWVPTAPDAQEIDYPEIDERNLVLERPAAPAEPVAAAERAAPETEPVAEVEDEADAEAAVPEVAAEPLVEIPRPDVVARDEVVGRTEPSAGGHDGGHQQTLFGRDDDLLEDATQLVREARRVSAALLQRKLRIDYAEACRVLAELAARGVVELEGDQAHGRVVGS